MNCFNFLRLNTCPCFTNFILTKINFIRKFNAAPLHVALSIDIGNRLLTPLHELMIRAYEREYVSFFKGVEFLLCPIASCIWDDQSIVCKTPGNPYHRLLFLSCLGVVMMTQSTGALWWERQGPKMVFDPDRNHPLTPAPSHRDLLRGGPLLGVDSDRWPVLSFLKFEQVFYSPERKQESWHPFEEFVHYKIRRCECCF